jgi:hypothetical protein
LSYEDDVDILRQLRLTLSNDRRKVTNVTVIENSLKTIPDYIKDDTLRVDIAYLRELADEAKTNDPIKGYSTAMPASRADFFRACFGGECSIGNLFTDALRWYTGADFAFDESGGTRGPGWPAGPVKVSGLISIEFVNRRFVSHKAILPTRCRIFGRLSLSPIQSVQESLAGLPFFNFLSFRLERPVLCPKEYKTETVSSRYLDSDIPTTLTWRLPV